MECTEQSKNSGKSQESIKLSKMSAGCEMSLELKSLPGKVKDYPAITNTAIIVFVGLHILLTYTSAIPNLWGKMIGNPNTGNLYIAMLSVAALQASFAGVVVVFGLSTQPESFRKLRVSAGEALVSNWLSISYCGFISAALSLTASLIDILGNAKFAPWFFELSVLFCAHGAIRLLWLLKCLIKIVQHDDVHYEQHKLEHR